MYWKFNAVFSFVTEKENLKRNGVKKMKNTLFIGEQKVAIKAMYLTITPKSNFEFVSTELLWIDSI